MTHDLKEEFLTWVRSNLTPSQASNIEDAMTRNESISFEIWKAGRQTSHDHLDAERFRKLSMCTAGEWDKLNDVRLSSHTKFGAAVDALINPPEKAQP